METEFWKDIEGFEGMYQVSNLGRVKSIERIVQRENSSNLPIKERIIKQNIDCNGYYAIRLYAKGKGKSFHTHKLIASAFLNHVNCKYELVVNHIDSIKTNNNLSNLEIVTHRKNCSIYQDKSKTSSVHTGVYYEKERCKWVAQIQINRKIVRLGRFKNEIDAANAYNLALQTI